jgi:hypothetical protein
MNTYLNTNSLKNRLQNRVMCIFPLLVLFVILSSTFCGGAEQIRNIEKNRTAKMFMDYYEQMTIPKAFVISKGEELKAHQQQLREKILELCGLWPLPERVDLDVHMSEPLDYPWCTVRRVYYQMWPNVYQDGLLYMPKQFIKKPAPAMLCPHGHWPNGNAYPDVQKRCLMFAKLGYVVLSPTQNHYEDLPLGISHQTHMIWGNMRGLDYLQSLPEVDKERIGICGASGGGLQTQMMAALDNRVKAATIVGLTCDYREIMAPHSEHCYCNHFPNIMQYTDQPEISTLGLPTPVQYLTMDDFTGNFRFQNFPDIQKLYLANGVPERVDCVYWPTPHIYDKSKRERTYWWMKKWVIGDSNAKIEEEPNDILVFAVETLQKLKADIPNNKGFAGLSEIYLNQYQYKDPKISNEKEWLAWRDKMVKTLKSLLGEEAQLPSKKQKAEIISNKMDGEIVIERVNFPSEGGIFVPTIVLHNKNVNGKMPVVLMFEKEGKEKYLEKIGDDSPGSFAKKGNLVVLPDVRFFGELNLLDLRGTLDWTLASFKPAQPIGLWGDEKAQESLYTLAWKRNAILWGRPTLGMACTDIQAVLDGVSGRKDADMNKVKAISLNCGEISMACIFAGILDKRITSIDADMNDTCFANYGCTSWVYDGQLSLVPFILRYGDVLQWASVLADRQLVLRNLPAKAGDAKWLKEIFTNIAHSENLAIYP